jgi:hypothetical protein
MTIELAEIWMGPDPVEAYWQRRTGAARGTLQRRVQYGGRKGRAAGRRLAKGRHSLVAIMRYFNRRHGAHPGAPSGFDPSTER